MQKAETVSTSIDLLNEQMKDVTNMRTSLLSFDKRDANAARKAIQNITLLRVYHQLARIIKFTEIMDKLEDRIYQSIESKLDMGDPDDPDAYLSLIPIQEKLQRTMIESHKLLEPYLSAESLSALEVPQTDDDPAKTFTSMIMEQESRERIRTGVQELLAVINTFDQPTPEQTDTVKNKAQEALNQLPDLEAQGEETHNE